MRSGCVGNKLYWKFLPWCCLWTLSLIHCLGVLGIACFYYYTTYCVQSLIFIRPTLRSTSHIRTWSWNRQGSGLTSQVKRCWSWYKSRLFTSPVLTANPSILPLQSWLIMTDKTSGACLKMYHAAMLLLVWHCENHALVLYGFDLCFLPTFLNLWNT